MSNIEIAFLVFAWMIGAGSPGPATLAISAIAMENGRKAGITIAAGICCGSAFWGVLSAMGVGALMIANAWVFELVKYFGAAYLLYLAVKSLKSAIKPTQLQSSQISGKNLFIKGTLLHLTNPKAILGWGAVFALALPTGASSFDVIKMLIILLSASCTVFIGYGTLFALPPISRAYRSLKRWFDATFALFFGGLSLKLLTAKIEV